MKLIAAVISLSACATTGRSIPSLEASAGGRPTLDLQAPAPSDEATAWFPKLASEAALPSAARHQRMLSTTRDRLELGVRVCVAPDGSVADVQLEQPSGSAELDQAAQNDIRQWRFEPYAAPATIRVCKQVALGYEPNAEQSVLAIRLVRTSAP